MPKPSEPDWTMWYPRTLGSDDHWSGDNEVLLAAAPAQTIEYRREDKPYSSIALYVYAGAPVEHPHTWYVMYSCWRAVSDTPDVGTSERWFDYATFSIDERPYGSPAEAEAAALRSAQILATAAPSAVAGLDGRIVTVVLAWDGEPYEIEAEPPD